MSRFKKWKTSFKAKLPRKSRNGPVEALVEPKAESTLPPQSLEKGDFSAYDSPPGSSARSSYLSSRDSSAPFASSSDSSYSADSKPPAPSQREVPAGSPDTIEAEEAEEEWFISRAYEEAIEKTQTRYKDNASEICNILRDAIEQPKTRYNSTKEVLKEHDWVLELMENVLSGVANLVSAWPPAQCALVGLVAVIKGTRAFLAADAKFEQNMEDIDDLLCNLFRIEKITKRADAETIHGVLVKVYVSLLEFYTAMRTILQKKDFFQDLSKLWHQGTNDDKWAELTRHFKRLQEAMTYITQVKIFCTHDTIRDRQNDERCGLSPEIRFQENECHSVRLRALAPGAYDFILKRKEFQEWKSGEGSRRLIMVGNTGCGKSMAVTFLEDHLRREAWPSHKQPVLFHHFCGDSLGESHDHILRRLVRELIAESPEAGERFDKIGPLGARQCQQDDLPEWKRLVRDILPFVKKPVTILISGLDSHNSRQRHELIEFLDKTVDKNAHVKYLLSLRSESDILPKLSLTENERLQIRPNQEREKLIAEKIVKEELKYGEEWTTKQSSEEAENSSIANWVLEELTAKARGDLRWIQVMATVIKTKGFTELACIKDFLQSGDTPTEWLELCERLFPDNVGKDEENRELAWRALDILATTRRPLTWYELSCAAKFSAATEPVRTIKALGVVDCGRVKNLISPFVTSRQPTSTRPEKHDTPESHPADFKKEVIFSSRHYKEFVFAKSPNSKADRYKGGIVQSMLETCIGYLLLEEIGKNPLIKEDPNSRRTINSTSSIYRDNQMLSEISGPHRVIDEREKKPMQQYLLDSSHFGDFFVYASCYWIEHIRELCEKSDTMDQAIADIFEGEKLRNLERLCAGSASTVGKKSSPGVLCNWLKQRVRPNCTVTARNEDVVHTDYDPFLVAALHFPERALRVFIENASFTEEYYCNTQADVVIKLCHRNSYQEIKRLFRCLGERLSALKFFRALVKGWSVTRLDCPRPDLDKAATSRLVEEWTEVFALASNFLDSMIQGEWGRELFRLATETPCKPMMNVLLDGAERSPALRAEIWSDMDGQRHQSVGAAVEKSRIDLLELLLAHDDCKGHLEFVTKNRQTTLHIAANACKPEIVKRLLEVDGVVKQLFEKDIDGNLPLQLAKEADATPEERNGVVMLLQEALRHKVAEERFILVCKLTEPSVMFADCVQEVLALLGYHASMCASVALVVLVAATLWPMLLCWILQKIRP